jgi:hypothetical protein
MTNHDEEMTMTQEQYAQAIQDVLTVVFKIEDPHNQTILLTAALAYLIIEHQHPLPRVVAFLRKTVKHSRCLSGN